MITIPDNVARWISEVDSNRIELRGIVTGIEFEDMDCDDPALRGEPAGEKRCRITFSNQYTKDPYRLFPPASFTAIILSEHFDDSPRKAGEVCKGDHIYVAGVMRPYHSMEFTPETRKGLVIDAEEIYVLHPEDERQIWQG